MDQNRRFRHKPTHQTKKPKTHNGKKTASSKNAAGKVGYPYAED
jgi:hypothetical protein